MLIKIGLTYLDPYEVAMASYVAATKLDPEYMYVTLRSGAETLVYCSQEEFADAMKEYIVSPPEAQSGAPLKPDQDADEEVTLMELALDGFSYLARDQCGELFAYKEAPIRNGAIWDLPRDSDFRHVRDDLFGFISWSDETPRSIDALLDKK